MPGPKPASEPPIYYAASRAVFDPADHAIKFVDAFTGAPGIPVVAIDTEDGEFLSILNGYKGQLPEAPLLFLGDLVISEQTVDHLLFEDAVFQLMVGSEVIVSGSLVDIMLDLITGDFLARTADLLYGVPDHLLAGFFTNGHVFQLMAPINAMHFFSLTEGFSASLSGAVAHPHVTFVNHNVTAPEPGAFLLLLGATVILAGSGAARRGRGGAAMKSAAG